MYSYLPVIFAGPLNAYDAAGRLLTLTDPVGNTTSYTYNYMGLVATETNEKNATRYYSYDALGRLVSKTDRNGRITTYTYDTIGRLTAENWSNTTNYFMYTYDAVGNLLYATDGQHSYSYTYDALNRPIYTTFNFDSQSAVFAYTYDLAGRRTSSSLSLNGHSDRVNQVTYDFLGNATKITQTGSAVDEIFAEFDYNANGLMTAVRRYEEDANDVVTSIAESLYTFNANNAVTSITHKNPNGTQIVQHSYTYDETNNIVEYLNSIDGQTSYDYDFLGQLIGADYSNQNLSDETYTYDENGNRITANGDTYTTGTNNELTSDGEYTYTYDAEGNRISKTNAANTERELYTWDYRNRLTTVTKQTYDTLTNEWTTVQIVEYAYDYNNVWIRKVIGTDKTIFIPENYQTTVQIDNNATTHHYLWTPNQQDKLLADTTPNSTSWALTDHLGTIRDVLGATTTHLIYDAFGNLTSGTNPILFGYTGKAFDPVTNLQNNVNRWYDATIGRWLSTDPIGFNGNDTNLYRYVKNRTLFYFDYNGKKQDPLIRFRNDNLAKIRGDNDRKTTGWYNEKCEVVSIVIEVPDPRDPLSVGHSGIGVGKEFYDFGPSEGYFPSRLERFSDFYNFIIKPRKVPGERYWANENLTMVNMPQFAKEEREREKEDGYDIVIVVFKISVCKSHAQRIKQYWENLYRKMENETVWYYLYGLHCTSAVLNSYDSSFESSSSLTTPTTLLGLLKDDPRFYHTCGENKGKPATMFIYS